MLNGNNPGRVSPSFTEHSEILRKNPVTRPWDHLVEGELLQTLSLLRWFGEMPGAKRERTETMKVL